jgi:hypothetical protein
MLVHMFFLTSPVRPASSDREHGRAPTCFRSGSLRLPVGAHPLQLIPVSRPHASAPASRPPPSRCAPAPLTLF